MKIKIVITRVKTLTKFLSWEIVIKFLAKMCIFALLFLAITCNGLSSLAYQEFSIAPNQGTDRTEQSPSTQPVGVDKIERRKKERKIERKKIPEIPDYLVEP